MTDNVVQFEKSLPSPIREEYESLLLILEESKERYLDGDTWLREALATLPENARNKICSEKTMRDLMVDTIPLLHTLIKLTLNTHDNPLRVILTDGECFNNISHEETPYDIPLIGVSNYLSNSSTVAVSVKRHTFDGGIDAEVKKEKRINAINSEITNLKIKQKKQQNEHGIPIRTINDIVCAVFDFLTPRNAEIKIIDNIPNELTLSATYISRVFNTYSTIDELVLTINTDIFEVIIE